MFRKVTFYKNIDRKFLVAQFTDSQLAEKLELKKSVISRMENHSEDIRLSILQKVASVFGKQLRVAML